MKKTLLLLVCSAMTLFAGGAFATEIIPNGDGITMAQPSAPPVVGSSLMAAAPPLSERMCPAAQKDRLTYAYVETMSGTGITAEPSPVAYDTGDPTDTIRA